MILFLWLAQGCFLAEAIAPTSPQTDNRAENSTSITEQTAPSKSAYVIPIHAQIDKPLFHIIRRGVKEAMEQHADVLILDMKTPGGTLSATLDIIDVLAKFPGKTVTYINNEAISAGAFISYGTHEIYMSERAIIGASAPVDGGPMSITSGGEIPETMKLKVVSMIRAEMRACAERYGHNPDVIEAMIDPNQGLTIGDNILCPKGELLSLTSEEASRMYGDPPTPLLSQGTFASIEDLYTHLGVDKNRVTKVEKIGVESLASWISSWSSLLLIIGGACLFIEYKTPGFGIFGIIGISAFVIYFIGNNIAGLGGLEWLLLFLLGIILLVIELLFMPGTIVFGAAGLLSIFIALIMAMVDLYPGGSLIPSLGQLRHPLINFGIAAGGILVLTYILAKYLPKSLLYTKMVSSTASGEKTDQEIKTIQNTLIGKEGVTVSVLRPGGKARFDGKTVDVIAQNGMIEKGVHVRIIACSGTDAIVEEC